MFGDVGIVVYSHIYSNTVTKKNHEFSEEVYIHRRYTSSRSFALGLFQY